MARYHGVLDHHHDTGLTRAVRCEDSIALFRASQSEPDTSVTLDVLVENNAELILSTARRMLCLDIDFSPFYQIATQDAALSAIVKSLYGVHHLQSETVFEALMLVIIEQQISLYAALRAQQALVEWGEQWIEYDEQRYYVFPTPKQIAEADPEDLHTVLKITRRRVAVMQYVANAIVDGRLDLEALRDAEPETAYGTLMAIKGIGHWTASWTLIRGLSQYTYAAHNDVALRDAVAHYFENTSERVSANHVAEVFSHYQADAGLAAFYTLMAWAVERY
jgi:DNA-3-methyladenine glycosylase II